VELMLEAHRLQLFCCRRYSRKGFVAAWHQRRDFLPDVALLFQAPRVPLFIKSF
jgi:hypothetical protein